MIRRMVPNLFTILNLLCGFSGIFLLFAGASEMSIILMLIALLLDFLDGFSARLLKATSELGKQLDSLSDIVSFGIFPAFMALFSINPGLLSNLDISQLSPLSMFVLLIPSGAALRLAKFNIDKEQAFGFKGLPTPAMAVFFLSLLAIQTFETTAIISWPWLSKVLCSEVVIAVLCFVFAFLMVSNIPFMALKFKGFAWKDNALRYIFLILSLIILIIFAFEAIPIILFLYLIISIIKPNKHDLHSGN